MELTCSAATRQTKGWRQNTFVLLYPQPEKTGAGSGALSSADALLGLIGLLLRGPPARPPVAGLAGATDLKALLDLGRGHIPEIATCSITRSG